MQEPFLDACHYGPQAQAQGSGEQTEELLTALSTIHCVQWPTIASAYPLQMNCLWLFFPFSGTFHIPVIIHLCSLCLQTILCSTYCKGGGCIRGGNVCQDSVPQPLHAVKSGCQTEAWTRQSGGLALLSIISKWGIAKKGWPGADGNLVSVRGRDRWQCVTGWKTSYSMRLTGNGWEL